MSRAGAGSGECFSNQPWSACTPTAGRAAADKKVKSPLISVIVPAYNAETTIEATLRSVLRQTYREIEVLVVDDGSNDATASVVSRLAAEDGRVRLIRKSNGGVASARNAAIADARGEYIAPIDADDIWVSHKLERQLEKALEVPGAGLVYAWSVHIDERGEPTGTCIASELEGYVYPALVHWCIVGNASTPLIRKSCLQIVGGYDSSLHEQDAQGCEDLDLYLRIAERWPFAVVPEVLVGYRLSSGNMSLRTQSMARSFAIVMARSRALHPELPDRLYRWALAHFSWYLSWQCARSKQPFAALRYHIAACCKDPLQLLHPDLNQTVRLCMRRAVKGAMRRGMPWRSRVRQTSSPDRDKATVPLSPQAGQVNIPSSEYPKPCLNDEPGCRWQRLEASRKAYVQQLCASLSATASALKPVVTATETGAQS